MTTLAPPPAVTEYANAVRSHLAALDPETLDELTGGLEADLAEALAERSPDGVPADLASVTAIFGSSSAYAEELRVAAGVELPVAEPTKRPTLRSLVARQMAAVTDDWARWRREHPWVNAVVGFVVALRPVWWLGRGWVLYMFLTGVDTVHPLGSGFLEHLLLLGTVVLSVLWGQARIGQQRWLRRLGLLFSAVAAIAVLVLLNAVGYQLGGSAWSDSSYQYGWEDGYANGLSAQSSDDSATGPLVPATAGPTNLFVYDAQGQPIENAQIVDQNGDPLVLTDPESLLPWSDWESTAWYDDDLPAPVLAGGQLNVYPWSYVPSTAITQNTDGTLSGDVGQAPDPRWPAATLFPVVTEEPAATDEADATEQPTPSDEPTPAEDTTSSEEEPTD